MKKFRHVLVATVTSVALTVGVLTGCTPMPGPASVAVRQGEPATLTVKGLTVDIPGESIKGNGTLVIEQVEQDGHQGFDIELTAGAKLSGPAKLTFAGTTQKGEPAPLVMSSPEAGADLVPAESVTMTKTGAEVVTTHFSFWMVTWWRDLVEPVKKIWNSVSSGGQDDATLKCEGAKALDAAGYKVKGAAGDDQPATWCAGMVDGRPEVQVKNERGYPMLVEASVGLSQQDADDSFEMLVAQLFTALGEGTSKKGASISPLLSEDSSRYLVANANPKTLALSSKPSAYIAQILRFAIEIAKEFPGLLGKAVPEDRILKAIQAGECIRGFGQLAGANPQSKDAATDYVETGFGAAFDCVGDVMKQVFKSDAFPAIITTGIAWVGKDLNLIGRAGQAVGDMVSDIGKPYKVTITGTDRWFISPEGVGPLSLGGKYDELESLIPAGNRSCTSSTPGPWAAHYYGKANKADFIYVHDAQSRDLDEESSVAPLTEQGITIGTPESVLADLGYAKRPDPFSGENAEYTWEEDGVPFVAFIDSATGRVSAIGVGEGVIPYEC